MNEVLKCVLQVFYRLSLSLEGDNDYFPLYFYKELVYDNWIFDMAKLYDLAAVYGQSNPETVKSIIANVFENDTRYVQDFKDSVDFIITSLRKSFSSAVKVSSMVSGDAVFKKSREEQDSIIKRLLLDFVEILRNLDLIIDFFPSEMLETVRNTSLPLFMANVYCLMLGPVKMLWLKDSLKQKYLDELRRQVKKLSVKSCLHILDVAILRHVAVHCKNYAVVQDRLASCIKQFILGVSGNVELSKDSLHRNVNFMGEQNGISGSTFLRKILNPKQGLPQIDLIASLSSLEERFL